MMLLLMFEMGDTNCKADTCLYFVACCVGLGGVGGNHFSSELKVPAATF